MASARQDTHQISRYNQGLALSTIQIFSVITYIVTDLNTTISQFNLMKPLLLGVIVMISLAITSNLTAIQLQTKSIYALVRETGEAFHIHINPRSGDAPVAISGDNIYIVWPSNRTGNDEVNFRASTDGGTTFADKINLSNSTNAESQDAEVAADVDNVIVTWWERNQTAEEPVMRISSDNGQTFGPLLKLSTNGTIGEAAGVG